MLRRPTPAMLSVPLWTQTSPIRTWHCELVAPVSGYFRLFQVASLFQLSESRRGKGVCLGVFFRSISQVSQANSGQRLTFVIASCWPSRIPKHARQITKLGSHLHLLQAQQLSKLRTSWYLSNRGRVFPCRSSNLFWSCASRQSSTLSVGLLKTFANSRLVIECLSLKHKKCERCTVFQKISGYSALMPDQQLAKIWPSWENCEKTNKIHSSEPGWTITLVQGGVSTWQERQCTMRVN
jgi:hypothetical protein